MIRWIVALSSLWFVGQTALAQAQTPANFEARFSVAGECLGFSATEDYLATTTGVYSTEDGTSQVEFAEAADSVFFSPDGHYALHFADGVYDLSTGEKIIALADTMRNHYFSADSTRLVVEPDFGEVAVYDLASGEAVAVLEGISPMLSSSKRYLAITQPIPDNPQCTVYVVQSP